MLIFALTKTDGKIRCELLDITKSLYYNCNKASEWYNDIRKVLVPSDSAPSKEVEDALYKLDALYMGMVSG